MFLWLFYCKLEKEVEETVGGELGFQKVLERERIWIQIMVRKGKNEGLF